MRICEQWNQMKSELESKYAGIILEQYDSCYGHSESRGPHVNIMIPAKHKKVCPCCNTLLDDTIPEPSSRDIFVLLDIVDKYLCNVLWDGNINYSECRGGLNGWYYNIKFDKVLKVTDA